MFKVSEKLINFRVYDSVAQELLGVADIELPSFESLTETVSGAGIAGEIEAPTLGHFGSQTVTLKWRVAEAGAIKLLAPVQHKLDMRAAVQEQNPALGNALSGSIRVEVRGMTKNLELGSFAPNSQMESSTEIECLAISIYRDGVPLVVYDKLAYIFIVNGVDYLQSARIAMGM